MSLENEICALLNIKSDYIKDKFKNVYLLKKRQKLFTYLLDEFGPFDSIKCDATFNSLGFYSIDKIIMMILKFSIALSILCCVIAGYNSILCYLITCVIIFSVTLFGLLYAK